MSEMSIKLSCQMTAQQQLILYDVTGLLSVIYMDADPAALVVCSAAAQSHSAIDKA